MIRRVIRGPVACLMLVIAPFSASAIHPVPTPPASMPSASLRPQPPAPSKPSLFSTYLGGSIPFMPGASPLTFAQNAACDALGNIYVTGATQVSDLPVLNAYQPTPAAGSTKSAFVAKYNPAGQLLWCTYLGGNNQSMGIGVAAMPDGGVAVVGLTTSNASGPSPPLRTLFSRRTTDSRITS